MGSGKKEERKKNRGRNGDFTINQNAVWWFTAVAFENAAVFFLPPLNSLSFFCCL